MVQLDLMVVVFEDWVRNGGDKRTAYKIPNFLSLVIKG
jgi:hypothetical protein